MQNVKDTRMTSIDAKQLYNFSLRCSLSNIGIHESINNKNVCTPQPQPHTQCISVSSIAFDQTFSNTVIHRKNYQKTIFFNEIRRDICSSSASYNNKNLQFEHFEDNSINNGISNDKKRYTKFDTVRLIAFQVLFMVFDIFSENLQIQSTKTTILYDKFGFVHDAFEWIDLSNSGKFQ